MNAYKKSILFVLTSATLFAATLGMAQATDAELAFDPNAPGVANAETFANPPNSVKPWVYYWCLKGNISKEQVARDLENIAERGFGGLLVFDSRRYWDDYASTTHVPVPLEIKYEFMSDDWLDVMTFLVEEAARRGLQISFNISDSGGQLRGPWDMKELGPYELIWTEGNINGPKDLALDFSAPEDKPYYRDFAVYALRIATPVAEGREAVKLNETWGQVAFPTSDSPRYDRVVDLTDKIRDEKLEWSAPEGAWKIIRFGSVRIGEPGCVDILNPKSVEAYYYKTPGKILDSVGELAGKTLTHFYNVSWEGVHPNWTDGFDRFFKERRKYDLRDYLPILRGLAPVEEQGGIDLANRFVADYLKTISNAFCANCYETIGRLCHARGVRWHSEDGGPWNRESPLFKEADMLTFWGQNDFPQGEFWIGDPNKQTNTAFAASAAHIYGRRDVALEAFTHMRKHWSVYPAALKPYADKNFIFGGNHFLWHTYTASPDELGAPGFEYFAGTHVNSKVTWQKYVGPFVKYMARCQLLLKQGLFNADVCVYASDKNYQAWGVGDTWAPKTSLKMPKGCRYDLLDTKVLVERLKYENGRFLLPDGTSYRLLVFDPIEKSLPVEAMRKLRDLANAGAPILLGATKPSASVGLFEREKADAEVAAIADALWNDDKLFKNVALEDVLKELKIAPCFEGKFEFLRRDADDKIVYFVSGSGKDDCVFRVEGKKAELWDATTGTIAEAPATKTEDGRTKITLDLPKNGSVFVVFSDNGTPGALPYEASAQYARGLKRQDVATLDGAWNVKFDPKVGGPESVLFEKLSYWNENDEPGIKYYSGTARYETTFNLTQEQAAQKLSLSLGEVRDIASVKLNGRDLGIVWTDPWEIALGDAPVVGENRLEIDVTNCWQNRLIGDAGLEPAERFTKTNVVLEKTAEKFPPYRGYLSTDPLEPSGLIGPVKVFRTKEGD